MDKQERAALDEFFKGNTDPKIVRQAKGVLRDLWPEFAEQLESHRGREHNPELTQRVYRRHELFTDPRFRDDHLNRPLTSQEAIARIAAEENITAGHVRKLIAPLHEVIEKLEREAADEQEKLRAAVAKQFLQSVTACYEIAFLAHIDQEKIIRANDLAFDEAIQTAHERAVYTVSKTLELHLQNIPEMVWNTRSKLRAEYDHLRSQKKHL